MTYTETLPYKVADISLAGFGRKEIEIAENLGADDAAQCEVTDHQRDAQQRRVLPIGTALIGRLGLGQCLFGLQADVGPHGVVHSQNPVEQRLCIEIFDAKQFGEQVEVFDGTHLLVQIDRFEGDADLPLDLFCFFADIEAEQGCIA